MRKYEITGCIEHVAALRPVYGDATIFGDGYRDALAIVKRADEAFLELPSNLRTELANDPANLLQYMQNPANHDKCVEYGLFEKSAPVEPNVVNPIKSDEASAQ
jgi:phage internal scaffolding protein